MYKGELEGFPPEIVEKMLEKQVEQGNKRDVTVFEDLIHISGFNGGFTWDNTQEGWDFWNKVLRDKHFNIFFEKYPKDPIKTTYPKVMMVGHKPLTPTRKGVKRVVFMEKCNHFLAWDRAKTIEESEKIYRVAVWKYAKDIEEPQIVELTFKDISEGKGVGVDPSLIRIKK